MSEIEVAAMPILGPLISSTAPRTFTEAEAITVATWVVKTALTASLLHPDDTNPVSTKYFHELFPAAGPSRRFCGLDRGLRGRSVSGEQLDGPGT
jgi:hypothetical protein